MTLTKRKWLALLVAMTMMFTAVGLGLSTGVASAATKAPKKIYLKATAKTVDIKGKVTVSVKSVSPKTASKSVSWKSSNKRIATVSSKGVVTGKRSGKVKITATSKKNKRVKKSITITVKNLKPKVYGLPSKATVYTGTKKTLKAKMGTGVYNKGITWKSSNSKVASVSSKGVVTLKKKGTATITAYAKESKKYKDTCKLTVRQSATSLKFKSSSLELEKGKTISNGLTISPSYVYSKTVTYSSSNKGVATVDSKGVVKGTGLGTATITATTKYGVKKTASYKVIVRKTIDYDASIGGYKLDKGAYGSYKISAVRDEKSQSIVLTNSDIDNILGYGNVGFDWHSPWDVQANFAKASFSYVSGGDYIFMKSGNKVTVKFGADLMRTNWYYVADKSFVADKNVAQYGNYDIVLFEKADGTGSSIKLEKRGDILTATAGSKTMKLEQKGTSVEVTAGAKGSEAKATFVRVDDKVYNVKLAKSYIDSYNVQVRAYK